MKHCYTLGVIVVSLALLGCGSAASPQSDEASVDAGGSAGAIGDEGTETSTNSGGSKSESSTSDTTTEGSGGSSGGSRSDSTSSVGGSDSDTSTGGSTSSDTTGSGGSNSNDTSSDTSGSGGTTSSDTSSTTSSVGGASTSSDSTSSGGATSMTSTSNTSSAGGASSTTVGNTASSTSTSSSTSSGGVSSTTTSSTTGSAGTGGTNPDLICNPGETLCSDSTLETCADDGMSWEVSDCDFVCVSDTACGGVCTPGAKRCSGTGVQTCNASGQWSSAVGCPGSLNADPICSGQGICGLECQDNFEDCDSAVGCETDLSDPSTCGSCDNACSSRNGTASCNNGTCEIACNEGFENCTGAAGCETTLGTVSNCETCGDSCNENPDNASPVCTNQGCDFVCDSGFGDLNGAANDGCEQDLTSDPENCGSIGTSCYGGTCEDSVCSHPDIQPVAEWTVDGDLNVYGSVVSLVVDDDGVYVHTDRDFLLKLAKDGSEAPVELASGHEMVSLNNLVVDNEVLYWVSTQGIYKVSTSGGTPTQISTKTPMKIDVEGGKVYWNEGVTKLSDHCKTSCNTKFWQVSVNGGTATSYTFAGTYHAMLKVVGTALYATKFTYTTAYSTYWIDTHEFVASTGAFTKTITGLIAPIHGYGMSSPAHNYGAFALNGTHLFHRGFFDDDVSDGRWGTSRIGRAPLAGSSSTNNIELSVNPNVSFDTQLDDLEADSTHVYYNNSTISRVSVNGGTPEEITPNSHAAPSLALDSDYVYWTTVLDETTHVFRAPK